MAELQEGNEKVTQMVSMFTDPDESIYIEFEGGGSITLRKWADAGVQEDMEADMVRLKIKKGDKADEDQEASVRMGSLVYIRLMTKELVEPPPSSKRYTQPIGLTVFRKLTHPALAHILDRLAEHNRPLSELREILGEEDL